LRNNLNERIKIFVYLVESKNELRRLDDCDEKNFIRHKLKRLAVRVRQKILKIR